MLITQNHRDTLVKVMRRAAFVDITELTETELLRGVGRRSSNARSYTGLGKMQSVKEWNPEIPYSAIHWGLSKKTRPMKRLVIKREKLIKTDWAFVVDCSRTMDFGTLEFLKRGFATVLMAIFGQAAQHKRDRMAEIIFDEKQIGPVLEDASIEEMVLTALAYEARKVAPGARFDPSHTGFSLAMSQLPDNQGIVPIMSDFLFLLETDKKGNLTPAAQLARQLIASAANYHRVLACVIEDPRERYFPTDTTAEVTLADMVTGEHQSMTFEEADALTSAESERRRKELKAFFDQIRCPSEVFSPDQEQLDMRMKVISLMSRGA